MHTAITFRLILAKLDLEIEKIVLGFELLEHGARSNTVY